MSLCPCPKVLPDYLDLVARPESVNKLSEETCTFPKCPCIEISGVFKDERERSKLGG